MAQTEDDMISLQTANIEKVDYIQNLIAGVSGLSKLAENIAREQKMGAGYIEANTGDDQPVVADADSSDDDRKHE